MALKTYQKAIIITVSVLIAVIAAGIGIFFVVSCSNRSKELSLKEAIELAKSEYKCDKVLWGERFAADTSLLPKGSYLLSHNAIGVVVEKYGVEVFLIIPSDTDEHGFFAEWKFDYSFTEIIAHLNSLGIEIDATDANGDGALYDDFHAYEIFDDNEWYGRFDINIYFEYVCHDENWNYSTYYIMQENHELRVYRSRYLEGYIQLS